MSLIQLMALGEKKRAERIAFKGIQSGTGPGVIPGPGPIPEGPKKLTNPKPRRAVLAQDGHSLGENAVYDAMWDRGSILPDGNRALTIGVGSLAKAVRLSDNACRANLRSLVAKLAIDESEPEKCGDGIGKTYTIYKYSSILSRRKDAGMEWVIRAKGVQFVPAPAGTAPGQVPGPGEVPVSGQVPGPGQDTQGGPGQVPGPAPGQLPGGLPYRTKELREGISSSCPKCEGCGFVYVEKVFRGVASATRAKCSCVSLKRNGPRR